MATLMRDMTSPATTPSVLAEMAARHPGSDLVVGDDATLTYREAAEACARMSTALGSLGLGRGDRIGLLLPNGARWCAALLAVHAIGAAAVPLSTWSRKAELSAVAERAHLRAIITQREIFGHDFTADLAEAGLLSACGGFLGTFFWDAFDAWPRGLPDQWAGDAIRFLRSSPVREDDDSLLLFTSGSTAAPKAVRLQQGGMIRNGHAIGERQGVRAGDRFWLGSPLFFVFGCANAIPNALTHAATICTQERFVPEGALRFMQEQRCTVFYGVSPITRALASCESLRDYDISALRAGTANATEDDVRMTIDVLGVKQACNAYGLTEGYGHTTITDCSDPAELRMASQGRVLPTQELRIARADGSVAEPGEQGEIQIRGTITPGYLDAGDVAAGKFLDGGWFRTGDIGSVDVDGRLYYAGRSHEMMKIRGINISPLEVEDLLAKHPRVDQAFVFGLESAGTQDAIGCVLVSHEEAASHDALISEVRAWAGEQMASYKVPERIHVLTADQIPLTSTGKVARRMLRDAFAVAAARDVPSNGAAGAGQ